MCVRAHIIDQGLVCLIRSIDSNMADLGLHITLLPISRQALPSSAATCQNQLLVLQIGLCLFLYVFPVFELLSVLSCSVLSFLAYHGQWERFRPFLAEFSEGRHGAYKKRG